MLDVAQHGPFMVVKMTGTKEEMDAFVMINMLMTWNGAKKATPIYTG